VPFSELLRTRQEKSRSFSYFGRFYDVQKKSGTLPSSDPSLFLLLLLVRGFSRPHGSDLISAPHGDLWSSARVPRKFCTGNPPHGPNEACAILPCPPSLVLSPLQPSSRLKRGQRRIFNYFPPWTYDPSPSILFLKIPLMNKNSARRSFSFRPRLLLPY